MPSLSIAVLGGGASGLSASLALARSGHDVTLVERDDLSVGEPQDSPAWPRGGIPHFLQPHAFLPRGRKEMRATFPDVFEALLAAGAKDHDVRSKIQGPSRPGDEEFVYLSARRPLIEWALRRAVKAEAGIRILSGVHATGLDGVSGDPPRVTGVLTTSGAIRTDLVVDAMGRRTPVGEWIRMLGGLPAEARTTECGILYYSRYYKLRPGRSLPEGPWIPSPRADLGYGAFSSFLGDNGTFAAVLAIAPGDRALKALRHPAAFEAAVATMPALHACTNPDMAEPITDLHPMGSLQNTIRGRGGDRPAALGVIGVGDTICHTDPAMALGLSFSLIHARALAEAVRDHEASPMEAAMAFDAAVRPEMEERFQFAGDLDDGRSRLWAGEPVNVGRRDGGAYALFTVAAGTAAALMDGDVFRTVVGRTAFLEPLAKLDEDYGLLGRIEELFGELLKRGAPRPGPSREELVAVVQEAVKAAS